MEPASQLAQPPPPGWQEQGEGSLLRTDQGILPGDNSKHEISDSLPAAVRFV